MAENTNTEREALMKLADAYADASFDQGLHHRTLDDKPEEAREELDKALSKAFEARASLPLPAAGQEPVARVNDDGFIVETGLLLSPGMKLYAAPQPAVAAGWRDIATFSEDEADELIAWKPGVGRIIVTWLPDGHPDADEGEGWHEAWSHKRVRGITHGCLPPLPPAPPTEGESNG